MRSRSSLVHYIQLRYSHHEYLIFKVYGNLKLIYQWRFHLPRGNKSGSYSPKQNRLCCVLRARYTKGSLSLEQHLSFPKKLRSLGKSARIKNTIGVLGFVFEHRNSRVYCHAGGSWLSTHKRQSAIRLLDGQEHYCGVHSVHNVWQGRGPFPRTTRLDGNLLVIGLRAAIVHITPEHSLGRFTCTSVPPTSKLKVIYFRVNKQSHL